MTTFNFQPRVGDSDKISTPLGASSSAKFLDADLDKFVKLGAGVKAYVPVAAGDDIEGVTLAIAPHTVNNGFSFGTVATGGRLIVTIDNAVAVVLRDLVVAGTQAALGTAQPFPVARKGTPTLFVWRVIDLLTGAGAAGSQVVIERVR